MSGARWLAGLLLVYALNGSFSLQDINEELLAQLKAAGSTLNARVHLEAGADDRVLRATQDLSNGEIAHTSH